MQYALMFSNLFFYKRQLHLLFEGLLAITGSWVTNSTQRAAEIRDGFLGNLCPATYTALRE